MVRPAALRLRDATAAVLVVGTELTLGLVADTNSGEIAQALGDSALDVQRIVTIPDDRSLLQHEISALVDTHSLVVVTGGLDLAPMSGTTPGQVVPTDRGALVLLPGPPHEMRPMLARLLEMIPTEGASPRVPACSGITEPESVISAARDRGATLATAESCTGGLIAAALTCVPGASDVFRGSVVSYADAVKSRLLGVDPALIEDHGAVSRPVAEAMSSGVATALGATHAVAVTGIAGPSGGSGDKPVGTVWFALTSPDKTWSETKVFLGGRELVRSRATMHALHLLRHDLLR